MSSDNGDVASIYAAAVNKTQKLRTQLDTNSTAYAQALADAIQTFERCLELVDRLSLFSSNESIEDVSTNNLQYLTIDFHIGTLTSKSMTGDRQANLKESQTAYERYLRRLDNYEVLPSDDSELFERYLQGRDRFSVASTTDAGARREGKIRRAREQKQLEASLSQLQRKASSTDDDEILRGLRLAQLSKCTHDTFESLESLALELHILSLAPSDDGLRQSTLRLEDDREKSRRGDGYSERLDHKSAGLSGPLLDSKGKPMRPFTLLGKRTELRQGVFRPDHSLPTMSIDEYLEEEKRRGGMIEGGGAQSGVKAEVDEDDMERADQETLKARAWDEYVEANPKGAGNTLNRG